MPLTSSHGRSYSVKTRGASWHVFTAAPHRVMLFTGLIQLIATLGFWATELTGQYTHIWAPLATAVPALWIHAFLMIYGLFPFFILGFLMTTYPRWLNGTALDRSHYVPAWMAMTIGVAIYYVGLFFGRQWMVLGVLVLMGGWLASLTLLFRVVRESSARDKSTEIILNIALGMGGVGMFLYAYWLLTGASSSLIHAAIAVGIWAFLVPILIIVAHRMIPFFSESVLPDYRVYQPRWTVPVMLACTTGHLALELTGCYRWLFMVDLPLGAIALYHTVRWQWHRSFQVRLLAMLHVAFSWFSISMLLYATRSLMVMYDYHPFLLGLAPLHALGIGFITNMSIAMVSRVTLGHSGRPLIAGRFVWICFVGVSLAAVLRVAGGVSTIHAPGQPSLNLVAALVWLVALTPWVGYYGRMLLYPRVDGRAG